MWILRFHKLQTKDYNHIKRVFEKIWFNSRLSSIIFVKALFLHSLEKKSWRKIWEFLGCNYLLLYNFYNKYQKNSEIEKIFYYFSERKIIIFIDKNIKNFSNTDLDENEIFLENTKNELKKFFRKNIDKK